MVLENAERVLKENWIAAEFGEEEPQSRDDRDRSPVQKVLRGEELVEETARWMWDAEDAREADAECRP